MESICGAHVGARLCLDVVMSLKFHGHMFDAGTSRCLCCDAGAKMSVIDPTNTRKLRTTFRAEVRRRWSQLRVLTKQMLVERDLLALKSGGLMNVNSPAITGAGSKIDMFQRWFDLALQNAVLQKDGSFMRKYLTQAYSAGTTFAQGQAKTMKIHNMAGHREGALQTLARVELEGIIEAVSQQAVRVVSNALLTDAKPMAIVRSIYGVIEKVGVNRSNAMIELLVVRAHAEASLDIYEAAGLKGVGLLPESRAQARVVADEKAQSKKASATKDASRKTGPGSRSSRKSVPSGRTIRRIRASELRLAEKLGENVNVQTAGDNDVCPVCEAIAENGPYRISNARSLIPAHPHCRCLFVPDEDGESLEDATRVEPQSRADELSPAG